MFEVRLSNQLQLPQNGAENQDSFGRDEKFDSEHLGSNKEIRGILKQSHFQNTGRDSLGEDFEHPEEGPEIKKTQSQRLSAGLTRRKVKFSVI